MAPYIKRTGYSNRQRILIAGAPNTGKTYSLETFLYGQHTFDPNHTNEALEYAADHHMAIVTCPGEKGLQSLPIDDRITLYTPDTDKRQTAYEMTQGFEECVFDIISKQEVHILALDGIHALYSEYMDRITDGAYLSGEEFDTKLFGRCHNVFGNFLSQVYHSSIPIVIVTTWEEWEILEDNPNIKGSKKQVLYPSLPGKMAKAICGHFDATLSARLEHTCCHSKCDDTQGNNDHHVWQFMPKGYVRGVGIKGLRRVSKAIKDHPYVHQNYELLTKMIASCK